jgi:AraC-like DNA-binding protein
VMNIIEKELSDKNLNGGLISKKIGLSRPQLYRKLMALTGLSINHFIRSIRLKRAAQLLQKKSVTVSEAAYITGFESLSYFTKKFKEEFGMLPSEY